MGHNISLLFKKFPKTRTSLPPEYKTIYQNEYKINREGQSLATRISSFLESWMHHKVAQLQGRSTLELGAGTLNQLLYEPAAVKYDIVEPFCALFKGKPELKRVGMVYGDISEIPLDKKYDRITSVAVLEHLLDLPYVVGKSAQLLDIGGVFQAAIPCEGELAWYLAWRFGTGIPYKVRTGLDYGVLMRYEHVNNLHEIYSIIRHFFCDVKLVRSPMFLPHTAFYAYIEAFNPNYSNVASYFNLPESEQ